MTVPTSKYERWPIAMSIYFDSLSTNPYVTITSSTITIGNDNESWEQAYANKALSAIVSEFNANLAEVEIVQNFDIGAEQIVSNCFISEDISETNKEDSPFTIRYTGFITRAKERSIIQLKKPRALSNLESWYARIGVGKFKTRFENINFQAFRGISPNAIYEFSVPEYINQEWSTIYGAPYKTIQGEIPYIVKYNPVINATVIRVSNTPMFYNNKNISIMINGVRQANSIIKYVDENNGLIYLSQKIGGNTKLTIDYSFVEEDYVYDAVDLNASIAHNPLVVDTFVAFYLKPYRADGALISGGNCVFHEVVNSEAAAKAKIANIIESTKNTRYPLFEPVIYLGSLNVRQGTTYQDYDVIDTRTRGGGVKPGSESLYRESEFYYDIGSFDGIDIPGNAAIVVKVPDLTAEGMTVEEIEQRATKDISLGIVPIIEREE